MPTTGTTPVSHPEKPKNNVPVVVTCLMLGMLLSSLGQMIFSTALPTVVGELGGASHMSWVITAFMLTMTIGMPVYGKLGDQVGRKPLYLGAIVLFLIGSVVGALSQNMATMIAARAIQGLGGGGLMVLSQAIMADVVTARDRGKYMGLMGGIFGLSSILGPLLGGFFTDGPGWRWALWFNIPLGLITLAIATFALKLPRRHGQATLDLWGTVTMAIATTCLILTVTWGGRDYAWDSTVILSLIATTIVTGAVFVFIELRHANPLIPMTLFTRRNFSLTTVSGIIMGVAMFGTLSYLPTYIQMVHNLSPTEAGLMMIPMMVGMIFTSTVVGQAVSRSGKYKWYPVIGMVIMSVGLFFIGQLHAHDTLVHLGVVEFVIGIGLGMTAQTLVLIVQNTFPLRMVGTATASNNFFRQIGGALGAAIVGSLFMHRVTDELQQNLPGAIKQLGPEGAKYAEMFSHGGTGSLTPALVQQIPDALREVIINGYNDALVPILGSIAPLAIIAAIVLAFVRHERLKTTLERD
nr:MDR family MFS transporter [Corynebacterium anserum]